MLKKTAQNKPIKGLSADKAKKSKAAKKAAPVVVMQQQSRPNLFHILNYQYRESDLEQFVH